MPRSGTANYRSCMLYIFATDSQSSKAAKFTPDYGMPLKL
jgi:hypothetical protein